MRRWSRKRHRGENPCWNAYCSFWRGRRSVPIPCMNRSRPGSQAQEETVQEVPMRLTTHQGRRAGLRHRSKHHGRGRGVATLRDRCKDRRGEDARALGLPASTDGVAGFSLHPDGNRIKAALRSRPCPPLKPPWTSGRRNGTQGRCSSESWA